MAQFANDTSIDLANEEGKRNRGACEENSFFCPFRFLHFPMMALVALRDIRPGEEIVVDYGPRYKL